MDSNRDRGLKKGRNYCLRLLSIKPRMEKELKAKLKGKGYDEDILERLLKVFKEQGLIDDLKFAKDWIDYRMRTSPRSARALKEELRKKGVPAGTIEDAMSQRPEGFDERTIARELLKGMLRDGKGASGDRVKAKMYGFLLRRGFSEETAEEVVNEVTRGA
jgi:regulatory protein